MLLFLAVDLAFDAVYPERSMNDEIGDLSVKKNRLSEAFNSMVETIKNQTIIGWTEIDAFLQTIGKEKEDNSRNTPDDYLEILGKGIGFITYDYGIDGVSIEIRKYADCLERIFAKRRINLPLHFIGGDFYETANILLKPEWKRFQIDGMNGWSKWDSGTWFSKLYYEDMPEGSDASKEMAVEMWKQAVGFAEKLGNYLVENNIHCLIPVNIPTNPGNFAIGLALIIVTECLDIAVISSNHDFYWEGGKAPSEKEPGEGPGVRDFFFKNKNNKLFFSLFKKMYPWNGTKWLQVNINSRQSRKLIDTFGFKTNQIFELGTAVSDEFFKPFSSEDQKLYRTKMAYILSDGFPKIKPVSVKNHLNTLEFWMQNQKPVACGFVDGLELDPSTNKTIYCLQPTRVITRKRIEMNFHLLKALMHQDSFKSVFESDLEFQFVVHISGPTPIEHQADLETVLNAYINMCESIPESSAKRIFIAFSVGTENHPSFAENNLEPLSIEQIYRMATVILFPSETEGRGLPIVESSACGVPIICSKFKPLEVFEEVIGEHLPEKERIRYLFFPEPGAAMESDYLDEVTDLLIDKKKRSEWIQHNKEAVHNRYSNEKIALKFEQFIQVLGKLK